MTAIYLCFDRLFYFKRPGQEGEHAISSSTDVFIVRSYSDGLGCDSDFYSDDFRCLPVDSSAKSFSEGKVSYKLRGHNKKVNDVAEDVSMQYEVSTVENSPSINQYPNSDNHSFMPIGSSVNSSQEEKVSSNLQVKDEKVNNMVRGMLFSTGGKEKLFLEFKSRF